MRMAGSYHTHDTGIFVKGLRAEDWDLYEALRRLMKTSGFTFHQDAQTKKHYPLIARLHHEGRRGDLEFCSSIYPIGLQIEFFQNLNAENSHGGRYDFDKIQKMRYGGRDRDPRVPDVFMVRWRNSGEPSMQTCVDGKYIIRFTDTHMDLVDTAGAGVRQEFKLGTLREFEAWAEETA